MSTTTSTSTNAVIAECAAGLAGEVDRAVDALVAELLESIPELGADDDLLRETEDSVRGNVGPMLTVFAGETTADAVEIAAAVRVLARSLARRRVPLVRLVQSYRVGQALFWRLWMDTLVAEIEDRDGLVAALHASSDMVATYVDRVVSSVVVEYEAERDRWLHRSVARRVEAVQRLLRGTPGDLDELSAVLGHDLRAHHTALVVWISDYEDPERLAERLEAALTAIDRSLGTGRMLNLPAGVSSAFGWVTTAAALDPSLLERASDAIDDLGVRAAAGASLPGPQGFRRSHEQALRAQRLAGRMSSPPPLTCYAGVELLALLSHDEDELGEFVAAELGDLAGRDASAARLRETIRVLLEEGGNARAASERLHAHRNTILYRVQRAEELLGRSVRSDTLSLRLALHVVNAYGDRILPP